jgi:hypothetical protein
MAISRRSRMPWVGHDTATDAAGRPHDTATDAEYWGLGCSVRAPYGGVMLKDGAWAISFGLFLGVLMVLSGNEFSFAAVVAVLGAVLSFISNTFWRWRRSRAATRL